MTKFSNTRIDPIHTSYLAPRVTETVCSHRLYLIILN